MARPRHEDAPLHDEAALRALFVAALTGDAAAYRKFLQSLSGHLRAFFRKRLRQLPDDVEDLVQETLIAVHRQRHTYLQTEPLTPWVHAIARYKLVDLLRARALREAVTDHLDEDSFLAARDDEASLAHRDLEELLRGLPSRQRKAIVSVRLEGRSVAETAHMVGLSPSAVKVTVHRGLKALMARIKGSTP